jgi:hypothetical protein
MRQFFCRAVISFFCLLLAACSGGRDSPEVKGAPSEDSPSSEVVEDQLNAYLERQAIRDREYDFHNRKFVEGWVAQIVGEEIARKYESPRSIAFDYAGGTVDCPASIIVAYECYELEGLYSNRHYLKNEVSNKAKLNFLRTLAKSGFLQIDEQAFSGSLVIGVLKEDYRSNFEGFKSIGRIKLPVYEVSVLGIEELRIGRPEPCRRSAIVHVELEPVSEFGRIFLDAHGGAKMGRICAARDEATNISLVYPLRIKDIL